MYYRFILPLLFFSVVLRAQTIKDFRESNFAFKVKQIDEFIDRFNHSPYTLAVRQHSGLTHRENLLTLFDQEKEHWDHRLIERFVGEMLDFPEGKILDFYDPDWYVELKCSFLYRGSPQNFTLILQNQLGPNRGGSKWVIVAVLEPVEEIFCEDIPEAKSNAHYLHPMSHVTNFAGLERAFKDKENLQNFFDPWNQGMDFLAFKHGLLNGTLEFQYNRSITYHFLQLDNWIFTVDYFQRENPNSGWLISFLTEATKEDKHRYKAKKLNLL
jgi:hypothetical protein